MVTIEQKLTLFSKLLNQDIKEEANKQMLALEKEYDQRMIENKFAVDKEAQEIVEQARKKAELKKVELISKGRLSSKKEMMVLREELIEHFMVALEAKIKTFTKTEAYKTYLEQVIAGLDSLGAYEDRLEIYLTPEDLTAYESFVKEKLMSLGLKESQLSFLTMKEELLGGLVIKDPVINMRIDESIRAIIDEAQDQIIEKVSLAITEVGDTTNE